jgi:hypothetical protein
MCLFVDLLIALLGPQTPIPTRPQIYSPQSGE